MPFQKAPNKCSWLLHKKNEICGNSCFGTYCGKHNGFIKHGIKQLTPCYYCGAGVRGRLDVCVGCGGKNSYWSRLSDKMKRLHAQEQ